MIFRVIASPNLLRWKPVNVIKWNNYYFVLLVAVFFFQKDISFFISRRLQSDLDHIGFSVSDAFEDSHHRSMFTLNSRDVEGHANGASEGGPKQSLLRDLPPYLRTHRCCLYRDKTIRPFCRLNLIVSTALLWIHCLFNVVCLFAFLCRGWPADAPWIFSRNLEVIDVVH